MKNLFRVFVIALLFLPFGASAFNFKTGSELNINNQDNSSENLYLFGGKVNFDDEMEKDLFVVSGEGNLKGKFLEDVEVVALQLNLSGNLENDTRLFGGEININGETKKDLFIVAGKVNINESAVLGGKTLIIAGEVNLNGKINNDIKIISARTYVNGEINSNVEITTQQLMIFGNSKITGSFNYFSPQKASVDSNSKIEGELKFNQIEKINENSQFKKVVLNVIIFWTVIKFLASLFITLILVFMFKVFSQKVSQSALNFPFKSFFSGLLAIILIPIICVILFASLFAIPISIILFFFYLILWILTASVSGMVLGLYIKKLKNKDNAKTEVDFNYSTIGIVILTFLSFVPWIGDILRAIFLPLSFGAMTLYYLQIITKKNILK
jgi:cytoskeletal protein CcmA (bactofilin family)